jgi:uncharacterized protein
VFAEFRFDIFDRDGAVGNRCVGMCKSSNAAYKRPTPAKQASATKQKPNRKEMIMDERSLRDKTEQAFRDWQNGIGNITDLFADNLVWTIKGHSLASKTYYSKKEFVDEVLRPFAARFSERFRPVSTHVYVDGDTAIVLWEGEGIRVDGKPYKNSYAWFMRYQDGLVVEATAFYDSLSFNQLWAEVTLKE